MHLRTDPNFRSRPGDFGAARAAAARGGVEQAMAPGEGSFKVGWMQNGLDPQLDRERIQTRRSAVE